MSVKPDLLVIGCDPVGFEIAFAAAGLGARVVLVEQDCPPDPARRARLGAVGVTLVAARGQMADRRHFVAEDKRWAPRWIVLANGANRPEPGIPTGQGPVTLVLGDGAEACVEALAASEAGRRVVLASPGPFLSLFHRDHVEWLLLHMGARGISVIEECGLPLARTEGEERVRFAGGQSLAVAEIGPVINCLPRIARLDGLEIGRVAGSPLTPDRGLRLGRSRLFMVGEALGEADGVPPPRNQIGLVLGQALFGKRDRADPALDLRQVPTRPGLAEFGLTPDRLGEKERNRHRLLRATRHPGGPENKAALLVVTDRRSRVVGASAYGQRAPELMVPLLLLARQGLPVTALAGLGLSVEGEDDLLAQIARQPLVDLLKSPAAKRLMRLRRLFG